MSLILVVQPDAEQARVLHDVAVRVGAELVMVDSTKRAVAAIGKRVPDLILQSALLSPRDEDKLNACLRSLEGASHLQTVMLPQFRGAEAPSAKKGGFGFRKKKKAEVAMGADPAEFAEEIAAHLARAREVRNRPAPEAVAAPPQALPIADEPIAVDEPVAAQIDAIAAEALAEDTYTEVEPAFESLTAAGDSVFTAGPAAIFDDGAATFTAEPAEAGPASVFGLFQPDPAEEESSTVSTRASNDGVSIADEISQLVRQLGLDVRLDPVPDRASAAENAPAVASAPVVDADAIRESALAEARAVAEREAREARAAEIARMQEEAEALRQAAIVEARAAAEREAREALAADLARAQQEAEQVREAAIAEARAAAEREAREALAADLARAQQEAEQVREAAIAEARAAAERQAREALAADLARAQLEAERVREAAIAEARAAAEREAREALAADLARVQVEAEQMRESAIAEARAAAEREAREALAAEVARVRSEAESSFTSALNKARVEAQEAERRRVEAERAKAEQANAEAQAAFARELARVRAEVEEKLSVQLAAARAEAERIQAAEADAVRERAAAEAQLKAELERLRFTAAQARKADESESRRASQQIKQLETELANLRTAAEERKGNELEELRAQIVEMREAAAEQARAAAAEAVAAEVARTTAQVQAVAVAAQQVMDEGQLAVGGGYARGGAVVTQFPSREPPASEPQWADTRSGEDASRGGRDYLSLWQPEPPQAVAQQPAEPPPPEKPRVDFAAMLSGVDFRAQAKWVLPIAACLIVVTNTGTAISTVARFVQTEEKPALTVQPIQEKPFIEVVEKRVGRMQVESTPSGAEVTVDGKRYGKTPVTIPNLEAGAHTLVLRSPSGTVTRRVTVKANQVTMVSEAIYSGWLAIFSPIPVSVILNGKAVSLTEDGRVMVAPGKHAVQFVNEQFGYKSSETLMVRPGETTAHTVALPTGTVRVRAPEGAEIRVDGQPAAGVPSEGLKLAIGAHEISALLPDRGERRVSVDVRQGSFTEVALHYD